MSLSPAFRVLKINPQFYWGAVDERNYKKKG